MSQARGDVAGGLVMDLDNCSVMAVDCEDRRYCFQITSFDGKKFVFIFVVALMLNYFSCGGGARANENHVSLLETA